jgi:heterodisulfide reductase subunit C
MRSFLDEVKATPGGEHIVACIQCGTCTGSCPMAGQMEYPPRKIIAMVRAGMRDEVLSSNSMWFCLSCYTCTVRCPRGVKPTELAHALESLANHRGFRIAGTRTPSLYRSFVSSIRDNGRVHEFGMMLKYYLSIIPELIAHPVATIKMAPLGWKLFSHKRLPWKSTKIRGRQDLSRIIRKFAEVRGNN